MNKNDMVQIRQFFAKDAKPVPMAEFSEFWKSLSDSEKEEFKNADLS
jgi:hypothetical protein